MNVSIIGTGHVGLITGACLAERGHQVLCVDSDERKIKLLKSRKMPIYEPGLEALVLRNLKSGRLRFGGTNADAVAFGRIVFICVPTPPTASGGADLSYIESVSRDIARIPRRISLCFNALPPRLSRESPCARYSEECPARGAFDLKSNFRASG